MGEDAEVAGAGALRLQKNAKEMRRRRGEGRKKWFLGCFKCVERMFLRIGDGYLGVLETAMAGEGKYFEDLPR